MPEHDPQSLRDASPDRPAGFSTRAIRAAHRVPRVDQRPTSVPIYQTVTFSSDDAAALGAVLTDEQPGYAYSRIDNPTVAALAAAVAELEGAEAGYALASGMAAIHAAIVTLVSAGDRIVATNASYGTTRSLFGDVLRRLGVGAEFVDITDIAAVDDSRWIGADEVALDFIAATADKYPYIPGTVEDEALHRAATPA